MTDYWDTPALPPANTSETPQFNCDGVLTLNDSPDLGETPPLWELIMGLSGILADASVESAMEREFERLWPQIEPDVTSDKTGFLLRVNCWGDQNGAPVLRGSPITMIGRGLEPTDALTMFYRTPGIRQRPAPAHLTNRSYFVWMTRYGNGVRYASIPYELTNQIDAFSRADAARLNATQCFAPLHANVPGIIAQAEAFQAYSTRAARALRNDAERRQLDLANERLRASQQRLNQTVTEYAGLVDAIAAEQRRLSTLQSIGAIAGLLSNAAQLGRLTSRDSGGRVAAQQAGADVSNSRAALDYMQRALLGVRNTHVEQRGEYISIRDETLMIFQRNDVPPPPLGKDELRVPELH